MWNKVIQDCGRHSDPLTKSKYISVEYRSSQRLLNFPSFVFWSGLRAFGFALVDEDTVAVDAFFLGIADDLELAVLVHVSSP